MAVVAGFEEVVIVAAHLARGYAVAGVFDGLQPMSLAREKLLLDVGGDFELRLAPAVGIRLLADDADHAIVVPGLLDEIAGPAAHGFHRQIDTAPCGHHHHRGGIALSIQAGQQVEPFFARSGVAGVIEVGQDEVESLCAHGTKQRAGRIHCDSLETLPLQQ